MGMKSLVVQDYRIAEYGMSVARFPGFRCAASRLRQLGSGFEHTTHTTALLVFLPAAARAGIITAELLGTNR